MDADGVLFEPGARAAVVDVNSRISRLTRIISMSTSVDGLRASVSLLRRHLHKKKAAARGMGAELRRCGEGSRASAAALAAAAQAGGDLERQVGASARAGRRLEARLAALARRRAAMEGEAAARGRAAAALEAELRAAEEARGGDGGLDGLAARLEGLNAEKSRLEAALSAAAAGCHEAASSLASAEAALERSGISAAALRREAAGLEAEEGDLRARSALLEEGRRGAGEALVRLRQREQDLVSSSGTSVPRLREYDLELGRLNEEDRSLSREISKLERRADSLSRDLADLGAARDREAAVLAAAGPAAAAEAERLAREGGGPDAGKVLAALEAEMRSMGGLNARAPQAYAEASGGYRSMSARKNSLEAERNKIVRFIEGVERDKRQTFLDAFDRVDGEIRSTFSRMTGGSAWLELQNEDDIFNSGISYMIQFQGKKKRTSASISGGEKTLAAIVFVLALQRLKPSPFYLFDEVDAHLDAPNAERLARILEERSRESQFLMVSLKDSVVMKAKLIYGVYPRDGASQVVTYKDRRLPSMAAGGA